MHKLAQQVSLEQEMVSGGTARYRRTVTRAQEGRREDNLTAVSPILKTAIERVADGIQEALDLANSGGRGKWTTATRYLALVRPDVAAYLALKAVLSGISRNYQWQNVAMVIANLIEDEVRFAEFREEMPRIWRTLKATLEAQTSSYVHKRRSLINRYNAFREHRNEDVWRSWPLTDKVHLGGKLLDIIIAKTGMIERIKKVERRKSRYFVRATDTTLRWLESRHDECELMHSLYLPMVVEPRPWTTPTEGGYLTTAIRPLKLVKTWSRNYLKDLEAVDMPEVYRAINSLQSVAWRVNTKVLDVVRQMWDADLGAGVLPEREQRPLPVRPDDIDINRDARRKWAREAGRVHNYNFRLSSKRLRTVQVLRTAEQFADEPELYFPHQMDWRGRMYPVPLFLNPQGDDLSKGLLTFATGKPLGERGLYWLAIHGANCYGEDRVSLDERRAWVEKNTRDIFASAKEPLCRTFWQNAGDPCQFLAFCYEWASAVAETVPSEYVCTLPVKLDGSCNGTQHFAAMLLDQPTAEVINLAPADKPNDIYQLVADEVMRMVEEDLVDPDRLDEGVLDVALGWRGRVDREVCKRPTMTLAYGATYFGFKEQVAVDTLTPMRDEPDYPFEDNEFYAARYMADKLNVALHAVVVAAKGTMDWLHKVAVIASKDGLPLLWTTPQGLPVLQEYREGLGKRVKTQLAGTQVYLTVVDHARGAGQKLDARKQVAGVAPNYVHSMDASHLMATVNSCFEMPGFTSFAGVHDSFGTLAADVDLLRDRLRTAFVRQYQEVDRLASFHREQAARLSGDLGSKLPTPPGKGSFDLSSVNQSDYFFA